MASRIHKRSDNDWYILFFLDPITRKNNRVKDSKDLDELTKIARDMDGEFYSNHPYMLPTGITLDKANKRFRVYTRYGPMKSHKTLMEAVEQKQNIISDLTEMRYIKTSKNSLIIS